MDQSTASTLLPVLQAPNLRRSGSTHLSLLPPPSPHDGAITFVYRHILYRNATPDEIADWSGEMDKGLTFDAFLDLVSASDEAASVAERELDASLAAVGNVFCIALGRRPTPAHVADWTEHLRRGRSVASLVDVVLDSPDARHRYELPERQLEEAAIAFVYRHALGREPTAHDLQLWSRQMRDGLSFPGFLHEVQSSEEGRQRASFVEVLPSDDAVAFVYRHALGREPTEADTLEWSEHLRGGLPFQRLLTMILTSEESQQRSAMLHQPANAKAIAFIYRHALGREATEADTLEWSEHLRGGLPFQRLLTMILTSEESQQRSAMLHQPANAKAIAFIYRHALGREATEADTLEWSEHLRNGLSFPQFLDLIVKSDEARARALQSPDKTIADAIAFAYRHALGREPTAADVQVWAGHFKAGLPFPRFLLDLAASEEALRHAEAAHEDPDPEAIAFVYRHALGRNPSAMDILEWSGHLGGGASFQRFLLDVLASEEARAHAAAQRQGDDMPDGLFVAHLYEICLGRCALPAEIQEWKRRFVEHGHRRSDVALSFIGAAIGDREGQGEAGRSHDSGSVTIMGTDRILNAEAWASRAAEIEAGRNLAAPAPLSAPYVVRPHVIRVSAIASLYKGGRYIRKFLDNMTRQSLGENFELIIIDAASPDGEREVIEEYRKAFPNIRYERMNYRIGIYDAWNVGVGLARGDYLTNTNLDDLRRSDSLELQAATLDAVPFADIVYQDFFYSLDPDLDFEQVEALGFRSSLPIVTANNLPAYNSPHNAPMWRKRLHAELGLFDTSLKSAGDHEFWLRCLQAGKAFYKINTPHVVYYQNPDGISTRPGTLGVVEGQRILRKYGRKLFDPDIYLDRDALSSKLSAVSGGTVRMMDDEAPYGALQRLVLSLAEGRARCGAEECTP